MSEHTDTDVQKSEVEFAQVKKYQKFFDDILFFSDILISWEIADILNQSSDIYGPTWIFWHFCIFKTKNSRIF